MSGSPCCDLRDGLAQPEEADQDHLEDVAHVDGTDGAQNTSGASMADAKMRAILSMRVLGDGRLDQLIVPGADQHRQRTPGSKGFTGSVHCPPMAVQRST